MANGDVPDGSTARGDGSGGDNDEAAWLELVARYDAPAPAEGDEAPWPDREDLSGPPVPVSPADTLPEQPAVTDTGPLPGIIITGAGLGGQARVGPGRGPRDARTPEDPADEHYTPPPAPPLPRLDPITKGAWLALIGGPLYLIIAKAAGWTVSGLAAFLAVAAFVGGFAVLVLRMDSGPPKDRGPDDGAVV